MEKNIVFLFFLITLQYCGGFATHWHESTMGVYLSPIVFLIKVGQIRFILISKQFYICIF